MAPAANLLPLPFISGSSHQSLVGLSHLHLITCDSLGDAITLGAPHEVEHFLLFLFILETFV